VDASSGSLIQWYPGHIARARRQLEEQLKLVDVVFEVLDARIPLSSRNPELPRLVGPRERLVVLNKADLIPPVLLKRWLAWFARQGEPVFATNSQDGEGMRPLLRAAQQGAVAVNERRVRKGMRPRPVRAAKPGVTRALRWIRIGDQIELLDSPGILPPRLDDQQAAARLAVCDDIGQAAYDTGRVAAVAYDLLAPLIPERLGERYGVEPDDLSAEAWLERVAQAKHHGNLERAAEQLLGEYRRGLLGRVALEVPPEA
jgi:ribosome biogenesis GTPase A